LPGTEEEEEHVIEFETTRGKKVISIRGSMELLNYNRTSTEWNVRKQNLSTWHTCAYETFYSMYVTTIFFNGMCVNHSLPQDALPYPRLHRLVLTVEIRQPSHEFTFGVGMTFVSYPFVLTPVV
jgi:hypothetical protein